MDYNITYRKKDKGLQVIISYKDSMGKWKQKSKQGFEDSRIGKRHAKSWAEDIVVKLKDSVALPIEYRDITFFEYSQIFLNHKKLTYSHSTIIVYEYVLKNFEYLNDIEMKELKPLDIQRCVDDLMLKNLSINSICLHLDKIKAIFNDAIKNDVIVKSPCKINMKYKKPSKTALTTMELSDLLKKIKEINLDYYIACLLAGKVGLRRGEVLGLCWDDISADSINVNKQWKQNKDKSWSFGRLKTNNSYRSVPISNAIYRDLMDYKKSCSTININNRVMPYKTYTSLSKILPRTFRELGYDITFHELRHTYTTILIMHGLDFKTVAKLIGDDVKEVMKTYSHVTDEMQNIAKDLIKNIF